LLFKVNIIFTLLNSSVLREAYKDHEQLTTVLINDSILHLFNNLKDYESSSLYEENEKKSIFNKNLNTNKSSIASQTSVSTISETLPTYPNFINEVYLYLNKDYIFNVKGYYITSYTGSGPLMIPDFNNLANTASSYGNRPGSSLFPLSFYNQQFGNLNDAISSVYVNLAKITLYEHPNYGGKVLILDARPGPTYYVQISNLKDVKYSCGFLCKRNWNDRISSAIIEF
ncbi:hypothetical protein, partial [Confluentibacter sediminis]|uniref:hypothetical protein n=1 Tax=Confluentibacter sediminis TaxID=2219045 RepID=UPI0013A6AE08